MHLLLQKISLPKTFVLSLHDEPSNECVQFEKLKKKKKKKKGKARVLRVFACAFKYY